MTSQLDTRALERLASVFSPAMQTRVMAAGAKRMGAAAEEAVPPYAPVRTQKLSKFYTRSTVAGKQVTPFKSKFKTQGQAFKVLKLGEAGKTPYRRSGQLGRSIISKVVEVTSAYALVSIGTSLIGAQQVIGDDSQQKRLRCQSLAWYAYLRLSKYAVIRAKISAALSVPNRFISHCTGSLLLFELLHPPVSPFLLWHIGTIFQETVPGLSGRGSASGIQCSRAKTRFGSSGGLPQTAQHPLK